MKITIPTEVEIDVNLKEFDVEEIVDELESRNTHIIIDKELNETGGIFMGEMVKDDLHELYADWKSFGITNSCFESSLKKFFEKYLDKIVA